MKNKKLPTTCYKGVRDFFPKDAFVHDYIIDTMARTCEKFGYEKYDASILEPSELYKNKSSESEEIVNEQTYTFTDRGKREVTLRPEMTPTVARMIVAKKRELSFPVRWYSIPNCFRYERTQRGRLREFWQLNADIFGASSIDAEVDNILLAYNIMKEFGANDADFEIRLNDRALLTDIFKDLNLSFEVSQNVLKLLDKRAKMTEQKFIESLEEFLNGKTKELIAKIDSAHTTVRLQEVISKLHTLGVTNTKIDTGTVRGFNYYTGIVFEIFDTDPENNRSLFGGGRYDDLTKLFSDEPITAVGFGMGDVTIENFLEKRNLLPKYIPTTEIMICPLNKSFATDAQNLANLLRKKNINTTVNLSFKKLKDQIKSADKQEIPFIIPFGDKEQESGQYRIKHLPSKEEITTTSIDEIKNFLAQHDMI